MGRYRSLGLLAVIGAAGLLADCAVHDGDGSFKNLVVTIEADSDVTTVDDPVELKVTAWNRGDSPIVWGQGSSGCQVHAVVLEENRPLEVVEQRICVADDAPQGLGPGESRTESWAWDGTVRDGTELRPLEPGTYAVFGVAGTQLSVDAVTVTVAVTR